eukprot:CAMPEP_0196651716 /NCGR_PEP_ID=MMETSP1086-20130531/803_1 /TAXON_ID=77921 /ORGANISM="Cyanoptyche  gloeocystis , Strain SAG4.97" /LENGTH=135 /DNA_ID=CAMNT_0041981871 /DNA_START=133 /DNA_END=540 /DNA_ORIENTATION=+
MAYRAGTREEPLKFHGTFYLTTLRIVFIRQTAPDQPYSLCWVPLWHVDNEAMVTREHVRSSTDYIRLEVGSDPVPYDVDPWAPGVYKFWFPPEPSRTLTVMIRLLKQLFLVRFGRAYREYFHGQSDGERNRLYSP